MDWLQILSGLTLAVLAFLIWPAVRHSMKNSPEGTTSDWMSALIPLALVGLFVAFLIAVV